MDTYRQLERMPYKLMLKVLDHIEVEADGQLSVIFLAGTKLCITQTDITPKKYPRGTHQISTKSWMAQLRMQCGMTQAQLADKVGTIRTYLNLLENGRRIPSKELAVRLGDVLDVPWTRWEEEPIQPKSR